MDGNCSSAFGILASFANNTYEGPFGQAHEVPQLGQPPYTPLNSQPAFKPTAGETRYVAIEGGSFFDAIVRGFFGYHAPLQWGDDPTELQQRAIVPGPRGFTGKLVNLRTPFGLATLTSGDAGVTATLQR